MKGRILVGPFHFHGSGRVCLLSFKNAMRTLRKAVRENKGAISRWLGRSPLGDCVGTGKARRRGVGGREAGTCGARVMSWLDIIS